MNVLKFVGLVILGFVSFSFTLSASTTNGAVAFSALGVLLIVIGLGFVVEKPPKPIRIVLGLLFVGSFILFFGAIFTSGKSVETHYHQLHEGADDDHGQRERVPDFRPAARP